MNRALITIIIQILWIRGVSLDKNKDVHQTPADLLWKLNDEVKLTCKHSITNYDTVLWYQRSEGDTSLKLIGYTSYTSSQVVEKPFESHFNVSGDGEREAFLHLLKLRRPADSGQYFCAASMYTVTEKSPVPLQKPPSDAAHLDQSTSTVSFVERMHRWEEDQRR